MKSRGSVVVSLLTVSFVVGGLLSQVAAQDTARISGKVLDENGDPVAGVVIEFVPDKATGGSSFEVKTNRKGRFTAPAAQVGTFTPRVQGNWHLTRVRAKALDAISIAAAGVMDATLAPGEAAPGIPWPGGSWS